MATDKSTQEASQRTPDTADVGESAISSLVAEKSENPNRVPMGPSKSFDDHQADAGARYTATDRASWDPAHTELNVGCQYLDRLRLIWLQLAYAGRVPWDTCVEKLTDIDSTCDCGVLRHVSPVPITPQAVAGGGDSRGGVFDSVGDAIDAATAEQERCAADKAALKSFYSRVRSIDVPETPPHAQAATTEWLASSGNSHNGPVTISGDTYPQYAAVRDIIRSEILSADHADALYADETVSEFVAAEYTPELAARLCSDGLLTPRVVHELLRQTRQLIRGREAEIEWIQSERDNLRECREELESIRRQCAAVCEGALDINELTPEYGLDMESQVDRLESCLTAVVADRQEWLTAGHPLTTGCDTASPQGGRPPEAEAQRTVTVGLTDAFGVSNQSRDTQQAVAADETLSLTVSARLPPGHALLFQTLEDSIYPVLDVAAILTRELARVRTAACTIVAASPKELVKLETLSAPADAVVF